MANLLQIAVVLLVGISLTAASEEVPDCDSCGRNRGNCYIASQEFCSVFYMCHGTHNDRVYDTFCCADGLTFDDQVTKTCVYGDPPAGCNNSRALCHPVQTTTTTPCPFNGTDDDPSEYIDQDGHVYWCGSGTEWNQEKCTCDYGGERTSCDKLLNFTFTGTFDSYSCHNFAAGLPHNYPTIKENTLCLNGDHQWLIIPSLNNWFADNPRGRIFTMCIWFKPRTANQTAGIVSTNNFYGTEGSVGEIFLENGEAFAFVGPDNTVLNSGGVPPEEEWSQVCLTFNNGRYMFYVDEIKCDEVQVSSKPVNSMAQTSLGWVRNVGFFDGYLDDFCFWTRELSLEEVQDRYTAGPSTP